MIVDKIWKLTNTVRVGLGPRSSHLQRQTTFPDDVYSYSPHVTVCHTMKIGLLFVFLEISCDPRNNFLWGKFVCENKTGGKHRGTRTSQNTFEVSRSEKS